ncbi:N-acetyltransferase [Limosilactobacillus sp. STM2_1]|uniref:N-acetyltransferase n=1 Tax=Limosilactobacillus rudii TaxID=2759755 RepID=A0A7W3ULP0_9LACO|nr:GNAT family N-acetyltransferase [Limosilactobacillus rudii]MBB1079256.1 N-acetyltransferase [Limosilactobacillus rudii]MBB1097345.1 N-acetyltransferase [Limosilactobacillus rudii]MCD7134454.1 N-acetyltransferase family protein [Limosilactobacillus rudii]
MISIQRATATDLPAIVAIYNQAIPLQIVTDDAKLISINSRLSWFQQFDNTHPLFVAKDNNQVCGWVALEYFFAHPAYQHSAEIAIYIDQAHQHQGLGQTLLAYIDRQITASLPLKTVVAYVYERNLASQHLFTKCGYKKWGSLPQIAKINHELRTLIIFGKHFN